MAYAGNADAYVYWANSGTGTIARANPDGTGVNLNFIDVEQTPVGVAVDGGHIYWTDFNAHTIGRANLDGTGADHDFITGARNPQGVAVDSGHIYWTNQAFDPMNTASSGTIGRANFDGTGVNQNFITGASQPQGVTVDSTHIYWTNYAPPQPPDAIARASIDGSSVNFAFITNISPAYVAVDPTYIYWTNNYAPAGLVGRASIDGTGVNESFIAGSPNGQGGIAVRSGFIYWANAAGGTIGRAQVDGTNVSASFITGANSPRGIAVDDLPVPDTAILSGPGGVTADSSPSFAFSSPQANATFECRLDGGAFTPCSTPTTYSNLTDGPHRFEVRATTPWGALDPTPAVRDFIVDTTASVTATTKPRQSQKGKRIRVVITIDALEAIAATGVGKIKIGRKGFQLQPRSVDVPAGKTGVLKVKPKKPGSARKIARAIQNGRQPIATVTVTMTDTLGHSVIKTVTATLVD